MDFILACYVLLLFSILVNKDTIWRDSFYFYQNTITPFIIYTISDPKKLASCCTIPITKLTTLMNLKFWHFIFFDSQILINTVHLNKNCNYFISIYLRIFLSIQIFFGIAKKCGHIFCYITFYFLQFLYSPIYLEILWDNINNPVLEHNCLNSNPNVCYTNERDMQTNFDLLLWCQFVCIRPCPVILNTQYETYTINIVYIMYIKNLTIIIFKNF